MRGFLKMSALSATLSFTLVTAYNQAWSSQPDAADRKLYQDRLTAGEPETVAGSHATPPQTLAAAGKGDRLVARSGCADQTWPYISSACLTAETKDAQPKPVRVITIEERRGTNTSVLVRVPQADLASR